MQHYNNMVRLDSGWFWVTIVSDMTFSNEETAVVEYRTASDGIYKVISIPAIQKIMNQVV